MDRIFRFCIDHPKLVNLIFVLIVLMGMIAFFNLKRDSIPNVDFKIMIISADYPGASAKDVEINVTIPIEEAVQDVTGIKEMFSYSTENFSQIVVELDPNTKDLKKSKDDIRKAVDRVTNLPVEVTEKPVVTELRSDIFPVFEVSLSGNIPELELRKYARSLEKKIRHLKEVASATKVGYRKREIHINVDLARASYRHVSIAEIMNAIAKRNVRVSGGDIISTEAKKKIVSLSQFENLKDVKDVIVRSVFSGQKILVKDIAIVKDDFKKRNIVVKTNGIPCINIIINKKANADAVKTAQGVRDLLENYNKTLPEGVEAKIVKDYSIYVNSMLNNVILNAMAGFILVIACLMFFLEKRVAFWTAWGIPFSLLVGFYFMPVLDIEITTVSMIAIVIVLGMLVDDAIVVAENIFSYRERGLSNVEASVKGVSQVFWPVVATVTTTIAAFLPILLMGGIFGEWIRDIPLVITVVLAASLFESVFILPVHLAHIRMKAKEKPKIVQALERIYSQVLLSLLKRKYLLIGAFVLIFIFAVGVILPLLGFVLFSSEDGDVILVTLETKRGMPIEETSRRVEQVEKIIKDTIPKDILASYVTTAGQKGTREWENLSRVSQSHWAKILINLIPTTEREITSLQLLDKLKPKLKALEGKGFRLADAVSQQHGPPVGKPVHITIIGNDDSVRRKLADEIYTFLSTEEAVYGLSRDDEKDKKELNIRFNYALMSDLGITAADVAGTIRAAFDGNVVTTLRKEGEDVNFRVIVEEKYITDPKYIGNLAVPNQRGQLIPLRNILSMDESESVLGIRHVDGDRSVTITGEMDIKKLNPGKYNKIISEKLKAMLASYPEFYFRMGGQEESTVESMNDFWRALIVALLIIYIILVVLFDSFTQPIVVMLAIPFGLIGVIFAFAMHFTVLSFLSLIGILGLSGVVVNNSLVMLNFLNIKQKENCAECEMLPLDLVVETAVRRFRPIILTSLTTVLGLMPALYGLFGGRMDFLFPLLLALSWGLVFATFITLFLIPAIYLAERDFVIWTHQRVKQRIDKIKEQFKRNGFFKKG